MRSSYKRIGDYIRLVDVRNKNLLVTKLLGLSISKQFIPSVANTVGTNMKNYKIIKKNQFACSIMQVRRDGKMPVALLEQFDEAIISQAYPVFEVIDTSLLLPKYLIMWFTRSEFDRQATFHAVGGVRGSLEWEDFLDFELPVPSISTQQAIVDEYNTIVNRISLNEQLNAKLEETAQALYKHWFVDFNFPIAEESCPELVSGSPELIGKPYKSSGGAMVYNEELDKEIPEGWEYQQLNSLVDSQYGFTASADFEKKGVKFLRITDIASSYIDWDTVPYCDIKDKDLEKYKLHRGDIIIARTGASVGSAKQINNTDIIAVFASYLVRLKPKSNTLFKYLGLMVTGDLYKDYILNVAGGSAQPQANAVLMTDYKIVLPKESILNNFNKIVEPFTDKRELLQNENSKLIELKGLILSKMATVGSKEEIVTN
tara:strand:+ start:42593 stop:43879 length:1287 start_codon:yes stop_codon:yes gene_type:complete